MNNTCFLCGSENLKQREGSVRDSEDLEVLECQDCGLVFLSSFEHITQNFYQDSMMFGDDDIPINKLKEITKDDDIRRFSQYKKMIKNKSILDFGCGCAGFLLEAKSITKDAFGLELDKKYTDYYKENKLTVFEKVEQINQKFDYIFMFHVLEHIMNPVELLKDLKQKLKPDGKIIVEVPNSQDALLTLYKNKGFSNFTYWSPHLFLYNQKTLQKVVEKANLKTKTIKQYQRYSYANHLYWLFKNKPGGHKKWKVIDFKFLNKIYSLLLGSLKKSDTIIGFFENAN